MGEIIMIHCYAFISNTKGEIMMPMANYTLKLDEKDKQNAELVFRKLGMSFSTGISIYLKTVDQQQQIPFNFTLSEQEVKSKAAAWQEFKQIVKESSHEDALLNDPAFSRRDSGREFIDFTDEV